MPARRRLTVGEPLETFDEIGRPAGLIDRAVVHATGLWHRAVHVWLYDAEGRLLLQHRPDSKDVCPGRWDLSVGEHLQPGEGYEQAAHRGLSEELGIAGLSLMPLGDIRRMRLDLPHAGVRDYELQQSFHARHDGPFEADPDEVVELSFFTPADLRDALMQRPDEFTPWAQQDIAELALI